MKIDSVSCQETHQEGKLTVSSLSLKEDGSREFLYAKEYRNCDGDSVEKEIFFLHDLGEHCGRYQDFFKPFVNNSITPMRITAIDLRGHGKSSGTRGHIDNLDTLCFDTIAVINNVIGDTSKKPHIMSIGLGGIIALKINHLHFSYLKEQIGSLILVNPAFKLKWQIPTFFQEIIENKDLPFGKIKLPFELSGQLIAGDTIEADDFDRDPLVSHSLTWATFLEVQRNSALIRTSAYYLDIPVFVAISGEDRLYDSKVAELFSRGIGLGTVHHYLDANHDLFHHIDCEKFVNHVYNWMKDISS